MVIGNFQNGGMIVNHSLSVDVLIFSCKTSA